MTCGWAASSSKHNFHFDWCSFCNGMLQATTGGAARRPTEAQLVAMFPDPFDWSTWNYNALSPLSVGTANRSATFTW